MGGELSASSGGLGSGATFTFTIPLLPQEHAQGDASAAAATSLSDASVSSRGSDSLSADCAPADACRAAAATPPPLLPGDDADAQPMRVLVAEDDPLCAALMHKSSRALLFPGRWCPTAPSRWRRTSARLRAVCRTTSYSWICSASRPAQQLASCRFRLRALLCACAQHAGAGRPRGEPRHRRAGARPRLAADTRGGACVPRLEMPRPVMHACTGGTSLANIRHG